MRKNLSILRFFHPEKSQSLNGSGIKQREKLKAYLVWDSQRKGTYIKNIHGPLK